ncbi:MAG: hypothetical protein A3G20_10090 [Acidobacteria bacterium RIFCSPLOWO2_12_FULL_59_11]|nr:MAG: hypothetical protein A3G20_10090 [Acidobacteria bacterium RIFCSPLOWO2_12_FULL_59_11]
MKVVVDIVDSQCSLRRRHLTVRAEKHLVQCDDPGVQWEVRDFQGVKPWLDKEPEFDVVDVHVVFLHASEGEAGWKRLVGRLAARKRKKASPRIQLLTYTGGNPPVELFNAEDDNGEEEFRADSTDWWAHCNEVRARRDYQNSYQNLPDKAARVGLDTDRPRVEFHIDTALAGGGLLSRVPHSERDTQSGAPANQVSSSALTTPPGLRHALINAVGPLRSAIDFALATGSGVTDLQHLWQHLRRRVSSEPGVPSWIADVVVACEALLPRIAEAGDAAGPLRELGNSLAPIEAFAAALDRVSGSWASLEGNLGDLKSAEPLRVLWIDDEEAWYHALSPAFSRFGIEPSYCASVELLPEPDELANYDAVVVDLILEGQGEAVKRLMKGYGVSTEEDIGDENAGIGVLQIVQSLPLPPPVFVLSARESPSVVRACTILGARDYFVKGRGDYVHLLVELRREAQAGRQHRGTVLRPANPRLIVGLVDDPLARTLFWIDRIASSGSRGPVMFVGEPGVGKEELAREVHLRSSRRGKPFVVIDCSTITKSLVDSELFGHKKGAFTGAMADKRGLFEGADGGVVFIDELDKLDVPLQNRLLRVAAEGTVRRVGESHERRIDVLLILASNVDPKTKSGRDQFSEPLVSRTDKFLFRVPPLRERSAIVPALADALCIRISNEFEWSLRRLLPDALDWLKREADGGRFDGQQGNIRGMSNLLERALVFSPDVTKLGARDIKLAAESEPSIAAPASAGVAVALRDGARLAAEAILGTGHAVLKDVKDQFEAQLLRELIAHADRQKTASILGTSEPNLRQSIQKLRAKGLWPWDL